MSTENAANEGGTSDEKTTDTGPNLNEAIELAVQKATNALKSNRDTILEESRGFKEQVTALQGQFETLGGEEGVKRLIAMRENLEKDERTKLLAEGKHDEWFDQRTEALRANHTNVMEGLQTNLTAAEERAQAAEARYTGLILENGTRSECATAGVIDSAIEDVLFRVRATFQYDAEHGMPVIKNADGVIVLGKDGQTPKQIGEWLEERKVDARHWFPASTGGGINGGGPGGGGAGAASMEAIGRMTQAEYKAWRAKNPGFKDDRKSVY